MPTMTRRTLLTTGSAAAAGLALPLAGPAHAEIYPTRNVRVVVPYAAGGTTDFAGRVVCEKMSQIAGHSFFVENKTGAAGAIGMKDIAGSMPDGYSLLFMDSTMGRDTKHESAGGYRTAEDVQANRRRWALPIRPCRASRRAGPERCRARRFTVADKLGLFAKQAKAAGLPDLTVKIQKISGAPAINDALISGSVDIGAYGLPGMLIAAEKTRGSIDIRGLAALVAGDNGLYTKKPEIKSLADFKPTDKIAVTSTTGQQGLLVRMAAEKAFGEGQSRRLDTMMIQLPHPDATSALVTGGTISAYAAPHPYSDIVEKSPNLKRLFFFSEYLGERVTSGLLATKGSFVKANPQTAKAIVAAIDEAGVYIKANPRKAAEMFLESEKSSLDLDETENMLRSVSGEWGVQPKGVMSFGNFMAKAGLLKAPPAKWQDTFFRLSRMA